MTTIALVGVAHIHTPDFAGRIKKAEGITCKYVWDADGERAARYQPVTGGAVVEDVQQIWADDEVQVVVICSETFRHKELVLAAAAARKHLFVEKPLGMSGEEAEQMRQVIEQAGVLFQMGYFMRSMAEMRFVQNAVRKGKLGRITRLRASNSHDGAMRGWFDGEWRWMTEPDKAGVGAFGDMGTHVLDLILWFMGDDKVSRCTGQVGSLTGKYACDEYGEGMVVFESGTVATLAAGWVDQANPNTLEISGTEGYLRIHNGRMLVTCPNITAQEGERGFTDFGEGLPHAFDLFLQAIQGQDVPLISVAEAATNRAVLEAIYHGANEMTWVSMQ